MQTIRKSETLSTNAVMLVNKRNTKLKNKTGISLGFAPAFQGLKSRSKLYYLTAIEAFVGVQLKESRAAAYIFPQPADEFIGWYSFQFSRV